MKLKMETSNINETNSKIPTNTINPNTPATQKSPVNLNTMPNISTSVKPEKEEINFFSI